jgi:hypothetical protein
MMVGMEIIMKVVVEVEKVVLDLLLQQMVLVLVVMDLQTPIKLEHQYYTLEAAVAVLKIMVLLLLVLVVLAVVEMVEHRIIVVHRMLLQLLELMDWEEEAEVLLTS